MAFRHGRVTRLVSSPVARIDLTQFYGAPGLHDELLVKIRQQRLIGSQYARPDTWQGRLIKAEMAIVGVDVIQIYIGRGIYLEFQEHTVHGDLTPVCATIAC